MNGKNGHIQRVIDAVRPIGNKRRAYIMFSAFAWLFTSGVIGGAGIIAVQYAPMWMSTLLAMLWLGVTVAGGGMIAVISMRMSADEPQGVFDRVKRLIAQAGVDGITARDISVKADMEIVDVWRIVQAIEDEEGKFERLNFPNHIERYRVKHERPL
jgi:hypothetical protein